MTSGWALSAKNAGGKRRGGRKGLLRQRAHWHSSASIPAAGCVSNQARAGITKSVSQSACVGLLVVHLDDLTAEEPIDRSGVDKRKRHDEEARAPEREGQA
jgi:hypothetical protein